MQDSTNATIRVVAALALVIAGTWIASGWFAGFAVEGAGFIVFPLRHLLKDNRARIAALIAGLIIGCGGFLVPGLRDHPHQIGTMLFGIGAIIWVVAALSWAKFPALKH